MPQTGIVFNIQHFTIHDGPGIRTELFMKGCPMKCLWCSNPEGLDGDIRPGVYRKRCLSKKTCGMCVDACPQWNHEEAGPMEFYRGRIRKIDYDKCQGCGACAEACPSEAITMWGKRITVDEAMKEIRRDRGYYERSGGGVTISGGEPLMQTDFVAKVFGECRKEGIHTCLESGLGVSPEEIKKVMDVTDLWIADIKMMDPKLHREFCGVDNGQILENLKLITGQGELILRIPVIPGINDTRQNMDLTADFISCDLDGRINSLQLLSFMRLGQEKYESLNLPYEMKERTKGFRRDRFQKKIESFAADFNARGIHTTVGTREKE